MLITVILVALALSIGLLEWVELATTYWAPKSAWAETLAAIPSAILGALAVGVFIGVWVLGYIRQRKTDQWASRI